MEEINYDKEVKEFSNFVGTTKLKSIPNLGTIVTAKEAYNTYPSNFGFTFTSDNLEQTCRCVTCRDYLHDAVRTFVNDKTRLDCDYHTYANDKDFPDMPVKNMMLLIQIYESPDSKYSMKKAARAVKVLNDIEEFCGIPITKAEEVVIDTFKLVNKRTIRHILLKGSNLYMQNPHMLSMVTLIMRFCSYQTYGWYRRPAGFIKWIESKGASERDASYLTQCYKTLPIIVKHREKVFKDVSVKELFPVDIKYDFHSKGGIVSLCNANTGNKEVNQRVLKMEKKIKKSIVRAGKKPFKGSIKKLF